MQVFPHDAGADFAGIGLYEAAREIVRRLADAGHQACFVGGFVRNWLLGQPIEDIDIATSATPDEVACIFRMAKSVGAHFGVMLVTSDGHVFEVATFRSEGGYVDRRHPAQVRFGRLDEDVCRRDFTVNAMYYDPLAACVIDLAGGRADLEARVLRTVGEAGQRFAEDALRLMRAVRFAVRYGLAIEPQTREAIVEHAAGLAGISAERVAEELGRILTGPNPGRAMTLMSELGLWRHVIPEIEAMHGCRQPPNFHPEGDVFVHTALVLDHLRETWLADHAGQEPPLELALAALLHDVGKPPTFSQAEGDRIRFNEHQSIGAEMADAICRRLRLSNTLRARVCDLVAGHMRFMDAQRMKLSRLRQFLGQERFALHLALHRADCLASHGKLDNYEFCLSERERLAGEDAAQALLPPPLIDGHDLKAMGLTPGPVFAELLEAVREEQLEGHLVTRDDALAWVRTHV